MVDAEMKPEGEAGGVGARGSDVKELPLNALRILRDPAGSLEALYRPGMPALVQGLVIGGASAVLIPLLQVLFGKMAYDSSATAGLVLKQCLGGFLFLGTGVALSLVLRSTWLKSPGPDVKDDAYLFGSATLFLLAGTLVGGIIFLIQENFFQLLAGTVTVSAWILAAFTYYFGLRRVAKAATGPAVWVTVIVLAGAAVIGGLLYFTIGPPHPASIISGQIHRELQGLENLFRPPGG